MYIMTGHKAAYIQRYLWFRLSFVTRCYRLKRFSAQNEVDRKSNRKRPKTDKRDIKITKAYHFF